LPTEIFKLKIKEITENSHQSAVILTLKILSVFLEEVENNPDILAELNEIVTLFENVHPEMSSIHNSVNNIYSIFQQKKTNKKILLELIKYEIEKVKEREEKTAKNLANEMSNYNSIMVISSSNTINQALISYSEVKNHNSIFVLESRPLFEGRQTAEKLAEAGYNITLVVDAAAGTIAEKIDAIVIGADTVFNDGSIINKIGSFLLALIANYYKIPFIVGASTNKISKNPSKNYWKYIQEKPTEEIWNKKIENINSYNIYFDFVPSELITKIITEK